MLCWANLFIQHLPHWFYVFFRGYSRTTLLLHYHQIEGCFQKTLTELVVFLWCFCSWIFEPINHSCFKLDVAEGILIYHQLIFLFEARWSICSCSCSLLPESVNKLNVESRFYHGICSMNVQLKKVLHLSVFQDSEGILHTPNFFLLTAKEVETVGNWTLWIWDLMD